MSNTSKMRAPELAVSEWFNTPTPLRLSSLRGRPILLHAFQLLCPGCVSEAIPQIKRIETVFGHTDLQIIGLHTVFEHHAAMSPVTLQAFLHEYRISSPVGVDEHDKTSDTPVTMARYKFRGTPSLALVGRDGVIQHHTFGVEDDLAIGARIAIALSQPATNADVGSTSGQGEVNDTERCAAGQCPVEQHVRTAVTS